MYILYILFMDCVKQRKQGGPGACHLADLNSSQSCFNHKLSHNNNLCFDLIFFKDEDRDLGIKVIKDMIILLVTSN